MVVAILGQDSHALLLRDFQTFAAIWVHLLKLVQLCTIRCMVMVRSPRSDIDEQMVSTFRQKREFTSEVKGQNLLHGNASF